MKIGIYSPYLDTAGGGEKYILTIAECLSKKEQVDVLLDEHLIKIGINEITQKIEKLHGLDLSKVNFIASPMGSGGNFWTRSLFLRQYDWLFFLTDGSIFFSTAKNSIIHFQVPFTKLPSNWFWNKLKLSSWKMAIYNSKFTKSYIEGSWGIKGQVIYPPVSIEDFKPAKKKKQILSVGRFFGYSKSKKHEVLINAFKELVAEHGLPDFSLYLAGAASEGDQDYLDELKALSSGYKIFLYPNIDLKTLRKLFGESEIYWHAAGFGETDPKKFEHFGITCVEAMAAGCIPVVINKGGLREIVDNGLNGYLYNNVDELKEHTLVLIKDKSLREKMIKAGELKVLDFSKSTFVNLINKLIYD
ncbi:MAG: glycosyltransferase [Candidatus Daviesbacteria bacterium]|nr:glycosyltransferase [Candidatus Daviesbacteria bacterium]